MKITIKGFITCQQYAWDTKPTFSFYGFDPTGYDPSTVKVMEHEFEVEVPDNFDPRPGQVAGLKAKKEEIQAQFAAKVKEIDDQINSLLAIAA
jgi:hypothetical protein